MNTSDFEASLASEGYNEVITREMAANTLVEEHEHPFDARLLILEGEFTLTVDGNAQVYKPGETFRLTAGCRHQEATGEQGARYIVGRRYPANDEN